MDRQLRPHSADAQPAPLHRLLGKIEASFQVLSPNDRRLADHLLAGYPNPAWETVEEVALRAGVSKAAVVRFATRLGYRGFADLQRELRAELAEHLASPLRLMEERSPPGGMVRLTDATFDQAIENLVQTQRRLSDAQLSAVAERIAWCEGRVYLLGLRKSHALAYYAHQLLSMLRPGVVLIPPGESPLPEILLDVQPADVVLAITARRYARSTLEAMTVCRERGAAVFALSDTLAGPASPRADVVLVGVSDGLSLFDSAVSLILLIEALVNEVASRNRVRASERLAAADILDRRFGLFGDVGRGHEPDSATDHH